MIESENVEILERDGKTYYIIGTAHVSDESVNEVNHVIETVGPDSVCVELCEARYQALTDENRWKKLDIFKVIREGKTLFLLANLAIGAYQRRIGKQLGVKPGAELLAGVKKAEEVSAEIVLVDRDIHITLKRTWGNLGFWKKFELLSAIMGSLVTREEVTKETIEEMKGKDNLAEMMDEFARVLPQVKEPLIDERDKYLMHSIEQAPGKTIVAVVGAGHVPGMLKQFGQDIDLEALKVIPPKSSWTGLLKWIIPAIIAGAFYFGYSRQEGQSLQEMLYAWVLPNSIFAALCTMIAGARPLSTLCAFVASPITSLNPLLGAGMVVGLVEAWLRKPTVEDAEKINDDVQSLRGIYKNRFTRVLLVAVMATMGSALGAWIGLSWVIKIVAGSS